jgi:hypothetical protein
MRDPASLSPAGAVALGAACYFGLVFGVGVVLGAVRVPLLVPRLGERLAELAEMPFMFVTMFWAAGIVVRRFTPRVRSAGWIALGVLALGMLLGAELLVAVVLADRDLVGYVSGRDPVSGGVYLAMLGVFAAMPWLRRAAGTTPGRPT